MMGSWFWLNIPLAALIFCCWCGIPLWLTLTRWHKELAERTVSEPVMVRSQPDAAARQETVSPAYVQAADLRRR
jgi:hypothetical protein